jgi:superfamily II DNA or RNA helicase
MRGAVRVIVASVQTMARRLAEFPSDMFDLIVQDEAHHSCAPSFRQIYDHFRTARLLGITATPDRADQVALGTVFQRVAHSFDIALAVKSSCLCKARGIRVEVDGLDLSKVRQKIVRKSGGVPRNGDSGYVKTPDLGHGALLQADVGEVRDLHPGDLGKAVIEPKAVEGVVGPLLELAQSMKTIVFAVDVRHAHAICDTLVARGKTAVVVHSALRTEERAAALEAFRSGAAQFAVNVMILTEGFDMPSVECVALARPTQSRIFVAQTIGRALRPSPGKEFATVIDFTTNTCKFTLVGPEDVLGGTGALTMEPYRSRRKPAAALAPYVARGWRARFTQWAIDLYRRVTGKEVGEKRPRRGIRAALAKAWTWLVA